MVALFDRFLEWTQKHRAADTYEWYRQRLQLFAAHIGPRTRVVDLRPFHVQEFIDAMPHSNGTKRNYVTAIKRAVRWAEQQGYIENNPIARMPKPSGGTREMVVGPEEFEAILSCTPDPAFRDLLIVTYRTGCRPQESLRVEARHVDLKNSRWVIPKTEAKNKSLFRVVYLNEEALHITRQLVLRNPSGKLFRNGNGVPWTKSATSCAFVRIQIRMGKAEMRRQGLTVSGQEVQEFAKTLRPEKIANGKRVQKTASELRCEARKKLTNKLACSLVPKYSLYTLRHSWATHALERGVDPLTVAILMGHKDPSMLAKVYQHLSLNPTRLLDEARKAAG